MLWATFVLLSREGLQEQNDIRNQMSTTAKYKETAPSQ
jgi:hypothetical protein